MTTNSTLDRRTTLKVVGSSMLVGSFGSVRGIDSSELKQVNLVEAGIRYRLEEEAPYDRYHVDGKTDYWIDTDHDQLLVREHISPEKKSLFESASTIIKSHELSSERAQISHNNQIDRLVTAFASRKRVDRFIALAETVSEPTVTVYSDSGDAVLRYDESTRALPIGKEVVVPLEPKTVTVRIRFTTDEKGDIPGMPDWRMGYKQETGTATVTVTPEIVATNFGKLSVVETVR